MPAMPVTVMHEYVHQRTSEHERIRKNSVQMCPMLGNEKERRHADEGPQNPVSDPRRMEMRMLGVIVVHNVEPPFRNYTFGCHFTGAAPLPD
jgi:hypothetical protein